MQAYLPLIAHRVDPASPHLIAKAATRQAGRCAKADLSRLTPHPRRNPIRPSSYELQDNGRRFPPNHLHESWLDYLYWDIELEA